MRKNLPVTQTEVLIEDDDILISQTDLKGIITMASPDFSRISGFEPKELIGQPHNILRHPDMPPWVFQDLWDTLLKLKQPWRGIIKNRSKNGDFYWVHAEVFPVKEKDTVVGFLSNRRKPTKEEREQAIKIYKSPTPPKVEMGFFQRFRPNLVTRMWLMMGVPGLILLGMIGVVSISFSAARTALDRSIFKVTTARKIQISFMQQEDQWKNLLLRGTTQEAFKKYYDGFNTLENQVQAELVRLKRYHTNQEGASESVTKALDLLIAEHKDLGNSYRTYMDMLDPNNSAEFLTLDGILKDNHNRVIDKIDDLVKLLEKDTAEGLDAAQNVYSIYLVIFFLVGITILYVFVYFLMRGVFKPVRLLREMSGMMSRGDLTAEITVEGSDEMSRLLKDINNTFIHLRGLTSQIAYSAKNSSKASQDMEDHAAILLQETGEQMAGIEEITAAIDELVSSSEHIVEVIHTQTENVMKNRNNSKEMTKSMQNVKTGMVDLMNLAKESADRSGVGETIINQAVTAMNEIKTQANQISDIINLITDISSQTNLLSLNAAIEAARAGEEGRGFAVVADEISRLADRTGESVKEIERLIKITNSAVENGADQFNQAATNFKDISHRVTGIEQAAGGVMDAVTDQLNRAEEIGRTTQIVTDIAQEIENAAIEQKRAMMEINDNVQHISTKSQSFGRNAEDLTRIAMTLALQTEELRRVVNQFKLRK